MDLSDKALAVFAFAMFHQLESGDRVTSVVERDGSGHRADPEAVDELTEKQLVRREGDRIHFTEAGQALLEDCISALRSSIRTRS